MNSSVLLALLLAIGSVTPPQSAAPAVARGIYVERADAAGEPSVQPMHATMVADARGSGGMKAMFGARPGVIMTLSGAAAALRLDTATPSFRLVLTGKKLKRGEMPDLSDMSMDAPSPVVKEGKEFILVKLALKDGDRELDPKKGKIGVTVEKVADSIFRLKPSKPLEPGEYALAYEVSGMPTGQVWDFSVNLN